MQSKQDVVWSPLSGSQALVLCCPCNHILYEGTRGPGKGLPLDEPVLTPKGFKAIGELGLGDTVSCPDGSTSKIIGVYPQGVRPVYKLTFDDGATSYCDDQHIWAIHKQDGNQLDWAQKYQLMGMNEVLRVFNETSTRLHIPTLDAIKDTRKPTLKIDPYLLGLYLGDGSYGTTQTKATLCTVDAEIADYVLSQGAKETAKDTRNGVRNFTIPNTVKLELNKLGLKGCLSNSKFIPDEYLNADSNERLALLQGLMDTDGTCDQGGSGEVFTSTSLALAKGVAQLVRSLGGKAKLNKGESWLNGVRHKDHYDVYIQPGNKFVCFRLSRKVSLVTPYQHKTLWRRIVDIEEVTPTETVCIKIAHPLGLFITRDYVVTHNTDAQLMYFRRFVGLGYGAFWKGIIFDRAYKNLDDLISKSKRWFPEFKDGARFLNSGKDLKWVWPTGEELLFRQMKNQDDYNNYHGHEYPFIGWNELTKHPTPDLYDTSMSLNRTSFIPEKHSPRDEQGTIKLLPDLPLVVLSTTNPYGLGHNWVKQRFIDAAKPGEVVKITKDVYNPRTKQREPVTKTQVRIFGSYKENSFLPPEYVLELESITDENKRKAWLWGDWDITSGGMFDDVWSSEQNIVDDFNIPPSWRVFRSFDWGSSHPFSVGWWAESDGSDAVMRDGSIRRTIRGDLYRIAEWYGWTGVPNVGSRMLSTQISKGIVEREIKLGILDRVRVGPGDMPRTGQGVEASVAGDMAKKVTINGKTYKGVEFHAPIKVKDSRPDGWERLRVAIYNAQVHDSIPREAPGLFVFRSCQHGFIRTVPTIPRSTVNMDDVDTDAEDHVADEVRYVILDAGERFKSGTTIGHY